MALFSAAVWAVFGFTVLVVLALAIVLNLFVGPIAPADRDEWEGEHMVPKFDENGDIILFEGDGYWGNFYGQ